MLLENRFHLLSAGKKEKCCKKIKKFFQYFLFL